MEAEDAAMYGSQGDARRSQIFAQFHVSAGWPFRVAPRRPLVKSNILAQVEGRPSRRRCRAERAEQCQLNIERFGGGDNGEGVLRGQLIGHDSALGALRPLYLERKPVTEHVMEDCRDRRVDAELRLPRVTSG